MSKTKNTQKTQLEDLNDKTLKAKQKSKPVSKRTVPNAKGKYKHKSKRGIYQDWLEPENLLKLEGWAKDGLTDIDIAKNIGIVPATLYVWKNKYNEIAEALKIGKDVADRQVENALFKRAIGYNYQEVKDIKDLDDTGRERVRQEITHKHVMGDVTAQIIWLKNRKPEIWRDRPTNQDRDEQQARIEKTRAQTETIKGIKDDIENMTEWRELIIGE